MRIAQISDLHFTKITWNPLRLCSKRIFGNLNWLRTRAALFESEPLQPLAEEILRQKVDLILIGGDLTTTSLTEEFLAADQFISQFTSPKLLIPGNHDCYTKTSEYTQRFYRYFSNPPSSSGFSLKKNRLESHPLAHGWRLIALDTTQATSPISSRGEFSPTLQKNLEDLLEALPPEEPILLWNHYPFLPNDTPSRTLNRSEELQKIITRHPNIRLYLQGHTHRHTIADLRPGGLPIILDSGCPVQKPNHSWNLIELTPQSCKIEAYRWEKKWKVVTEKHFVWSHLP